MAVTAKLDEIDGWLRDRFAALLEEHRVPGAAIAVASGGEVVDHAAGVLSMATGVAATPDSVFQVGSITKVWTTTLVMQLVDEGTVELDRPLRAYVPEFTLADERAAATLTVRQLLCHTAGFEGDIFTDTGTGEDCVEKYVATLGDVPQLFEPGAMFSYNNAGFCALGRLVEMVRGKPYDVCLREHLFAPLGLTHAAAGPYEAILHRAAVGHIQPGPDAELQPAPVWALTRSNAPAGAMLAMRPRDLLAFARMHLDGGTAADGTRVLSEASAAAMRERQVELPDLGVLGDAWGLGWEIFDWAGGPVIGHDGGTIGQSAFLRVVPEKDVSVALLTNGGETMALYHAIYSHVLAELAGVEVPPQPAPSGARAPADGARYVGTYASRLFDNVVSQDGDGRIWLDQTPKGLAVEIGQQPKRVELLPWRGDTLLAAEAEQGVHMPHAFVGDDGRGRALYLHTSRADRRVEEA